MGLVIRKRKEAKLDRRLVGNRNSMQPKAKQMLGFALAANARYFPGEIKPGCRSASEARHESISHTGRSLRELWSRLRTLLNRRKTRLRQTEHPNPESFGAVPANSGRTWEIFHSFPSGSNFGNGCDRPA